MAAKTGVQSYPRISNTGLLDDSKLVTHTKKIPVEQIRAYIKNSIEKTNKKSSRAILRIPENASQSEVEKIYIREGKNFLTISRKILWRPCFDSLRYSRKALSRRL